MIDLPPIETLRHLLARLKANDIAWFGDRYRAGDLAWLQDRLPDGDYVELGRRLEAGDLNFLRLRLSKLDLPGITLFHNLVPMGGTVGPNATGPVGEVEPEPEPRRSFLWLAPFLLLAAVLMGFGLSKCGNGTDGSSPVGADSTAASASDSTGDSLLADPETTVVATEPTSLLNTLQSAGNFTILTDLVRRAGLTDTLNGKGPFTFFAPTDDAFAKLDPAEVRLLQDPRNTDQLSRLLKYHVVAGAKKAASLRTGNLKTVDGASLRLTVDGGMVTINANSVVTAADIIASNGVIHVVDMVLTPADLAALVGGSDASTATTTTSSAATTSSVTTVPSDVTVALQDPQFSTLTAALSAAGLTTSLQGPGPFTVFAPTNDAFAKVPAPVLTALLLPANKATLVKVLSNHVVAGRLGVADFGPGKFTTLEGATLNINPLDSKPGFTVNDGLAGGPEIPASNGIVHPIDRVLIPAGVDLSTLVAADGGTDATATTVAVPSTVLASTTVASTITVAPVTTVAVPEGLTVYFGSGSARLDNAATAKITAAAPTLAALGAGSTVRIVGHADVRGNADANKALSIVRANNVKNALQSALGADASKITFEVSAVGSTQPEADLAKSRRVTIEIQP